MQQRFNRTNRFLSRQKPSTILVFGLAGMLIVGWLDYLTGPEYAFSLFYLFPIMLAAWWGNPPTGLLLALLSAVSWAVANLLAGEQYSSLWVFPFNTLIRLAFFLIFTELLLQIRRSWEKQRLLARTDPLTGAFNSRAFYEIAANRLERCKRKGRPLSLAYLDLDNFKYINDHLGHLQGDQVLRVVVEVLHNTLRKTDVIARVGGDEFAVLLPNAHPDAAEHALERVRLALAQRMQQENWPVTFSAGLVTCACTGEIADLETLIRSADDAMYVAKRKGKNTVDQHLLD